jgi:hypothetical protein
MHLDVATRDFGRVDAHHNAFAGDVEVVSEDNNLRSEYEIKISEKPEFKQKEKSKKE